MTDFIMARLKAGSSDPADTAGVATYTYAGLSIDLPMPDFSRAQEVERFMARLLRQSRKQAITAVVAQMRGMANTMEADA